MSLTTSVTKQLTDRRDKVIPRSIRIAALATGLLAIPAAYAAEVAGIKIDDQIKAKFGGRTFHEE